MADIFLSYNRKDQAVARRFAQGFEGAGLSVWWDTTLRSGEAYDEVTEAALRGAKAVVVLWSPRSVGSRWVRAEATLAERAGTLLPVTIEPCERPIMFELIQTTDLSGWSGSASNPAWLAFLDEVRRFVGTGQDAAAPPPAAARATVLAILAFDNLSSDANLGYFSDGVSEEILHTVARARDLRVIGKASSFQLRGADKSAQKVAEVLGATHMLDGSVRRAGDNIRIRAELVDTATLETLWSERYDRALTDIFALQDEIAGAIAEALEHHFTPAKAVAQVDPAAYDLYLRARALFTEDSSWETKQRCVALLESAVELDPGFAQAWGLLAAFRHGEPAVAAARRGLELNPDCANALAALSFTKSGPDEHIERLELIERAYALAPDDPFVSTAYLAALLSLGLLSPAIEVADARFARDPLSPVTAGLRAFIYCYAGRNDEAITFSDALLARLPDSEFAKYTRGGVAIYNGDLDRADAIADTMKSTSNVTALRPPVAFIRAMLALAPEERVAQAGAFLRRHAPTSYLLDIGLASVVGEGEAAIGHLLAAIEAGDPILFTADNDGREPADAWITTGLFMPAFRPIRFDPRFAEICVRMGVYACWAQTGRWPDCVAEVAPVYDLKAECAGIAQAARGKAMSLP